MGVKGRWSTGVFEGREKSGGKIKKLKKARRRQRKRVGRGERERKKMKLIRLCSRRKWGARGMGGPANGTFVSTPGGRRALRQPDSPGSGRGCFEPWFRHPENISP